MAQEKAPAKEQSMEEILQSIKRIIAEENDGSADAPASGGGDVLELTDLVDDAEPFDHGAEKAIAAVAPAAPAVSSPPVEAPKAAAPAPKPAPKEESELLVAMPISKPTVESTKDVLKDIDSLLSDETRKASSAMMKSLSEKKPAPAPVVPVGTSMQFRSGNTVEDLVMEALKPMLKDWLDANLLQIVEKLVQKEISKINS